MLGVFNKFDAGLTDHTLTDRTRFGIGRLTIFGKSGDDNSMCSTPVFDPDQCVNFCV
jgi:hypothetical protein